MVDLSTYGRSPEGTTEGMTKLFMYMYYVYFLKSLRNDDLYIGSCADLNKRLKRHNNGLVKSTKAYRPWKLLGCEEYKTRNEAIKRERFLKSGQQREILKKKYGQVAK